MIPLFFIKIPEIFITQKLYLIYKIKIFFNLLMQILLSFECN